MCRCIFLFIFMVVPAFADSGWFNGDSAKQVDLKDVIRQIPKGSVVILSEGHDFAPHQANQELVMRELARAGHSVDSALEFLQRQYGVELEQYLAGQMDDLSFTKAVGWGGNQFALYKPLIWTPVAMGGRSWAINADRRLTDRVAKVGLNGLTEAEQRELPPGFTLGNSEYFERFVEAMRDHAPPEMLPNYFAAMSIWDETMAHEIKRIHEGAPERTLVVIVGDFHNAYGGGLPDSLRVRGVTNVVSISQVAKIDQTCDQLKKEIAPDSRWGRRADWVWVNP